MVVAIADPVRYTGCLLPPIFNGSTGSRTKQKQTGRKRVPTTNGALAACGLARGSPAFAHVDVHVHVSKDIKCSSHSIRADYQKDVAFHLRPRLGVGTGCSRGGRPSSRGRSSGIGARVTCAVNDESTIAEPAITETDVDVPTSPIESSVSMRESEAFAVLNTGEFECRSCGYVYDERRGDPSYPIPSGLSFSSLPDDWCCPVCGSPASFFSSKRVEVAGFATNQKYGLGGNSLTSGQKSLLIYGSLLAFFAVFLSGYLLQ